MNSQVLIFFSELFLGLVSLFAIVVIVGAFVYDLIQIHKNKRLKSTFNKLNKNRQPTIAVLIYAANDDATLIDCIDSVAHSTYKNYQIIVINNANKNLVNKLIKIYQQKYPKVPLITHFKRNPGSQVQALYQGYKKVKPSELVFILNSNSTILPKTLKECAVYFIDDPALGALQIGSKIIHLPSLLVMMQQLFQASLNQYNKFRFLLPLKIIRLGSGNMYKSDLFIELTKSQVKSKKALFRKNVVYKPQCKVKYTYNNSRYVTKQGNLSVKSFRFPPIVLPRMINPSINSNKKLTILKASLLKVLFIVVYMIVGVSIALFIPLITYFIYTATTLQSNSLFILSLLILVIWLLSTIWVDEHSHISEKIEQTIYVPAVYFILYLQLIMLIIATIIRIISSYSSVRGPSSNR